MRTSKQEREAVLRATGFSGGHTVSPAEALALKADVGLPWNRLRLLRRLHFIFHHATHRKCETKTVLPTGGSNTGDYR